MAIVSVRCIPVAVSLLQSCHFNFINIKTCPNSLLGSFSYPPVATAQILLHCYEKLEISYVLQRQKAAKLIAIARSLSTDACRAAKRQRIQLIQPKLIQRSSSSRSPILGARVAIFWPNDKQYYKV